MSSEMSSRASTLRTAFSMAVWRSIAITERVRSAVLVDDVGVGEHALAGAARMGHDLCAGAAVLERQTHACGQPVVHGELVVGLFVACFRAIDEVPHVVAVDPLLGELVNQHFSVEQRHRDGVGDVHLGTDWLQRAHRLPSAVSVGGFRHVDVDPFNLVGLHLVLGAQLQCGVDSSVQ